MHVHNFNDIYVCLLVFFVCLFLGFLCFFFCVDFLGEGCQLGLESAFCTVIQIQSFVLLKACEVEQAGHEVPLPVSVM